MEEEHSLQKSFSEYPQTLSERGKLSESGKIPAWMLNEDLCARVEKAFSMYLKRISPTVIAEEFINPKTGKPLSTQQIWRYIKMARQAREFIFTNDIKHLVQEQVEARRGIIAELRQQLELLRMPYMQYDERTGQYEPVPSERGLTWTDKDAKASVEILKAIGEQEEAIESLFGLSKSRPPLTVSVESGEGSSVSVIQVAGKVSSAKGSPPVLERASSVVEAEEWNVIEGD